MGGASRAVMSKIMAHDGAAKAMATTMEQMAAQQATPSSDDAAFRPGAGVPPLTGPRDAAQPGRPTAAKATAAAWPTLSESTPAWIGMRTRRSAAASAAG